MNIPWYCKACKHPNMYTLTCSNCGEPVDPALKAREQEIMETVIKTTPWICGACKHPNVYTLTCSHCGEPVSDESVLKLAKDVAKAQMMLDKMDPQGNSAPIVQSVPQSWNCSYCGAQNSGNFCESCGAKRP